jgi:hypothetical protein
VFVIARLLVRLGLVFGALGCSKPPALPPPAVMDRSPSRAPAAPPSSALPPPAAQSSGTALPGETPRTGALCASALSEGSFAATEFVRLHAGPAISVAVGTPPRAAVWSGRSVTLFEGDVSRELPAPRLAAGTTVDVFFGRDDQPRLMGFTAGEPGKEPAVYLRFRQGTFRPEPSELGPLAGRRGALYGVLGFDDPEVVCRARELCLVKRVTGWGRAAAHPAPARIVLRGGRVFALHAAHIERLEENRWSVLEPAREFDRPSDVWLTPSGDLWVTDASAGGLHRLKGAEWQALESPVTEPRAVFGRSDRAIYVVGTGGAAEYDGARFRCVKGAPGPLHLALAVGDDTWLAGAGGVYRSVR